MPTLLSTTAPGNTIVEARTIENALEWYAVKAELNEEERSFIHKAHPRKALEFVASRYLLKELTGITGRVDCLHDEAGKPYIAGDQREISLSHTQSAVAVAVSDKPVGVDIQFFSKKILRIRDKFLDDADVKSGSRIDLADHIVALAWSAKESMYKLWALGEVDFRKHLRLDLMNEVPSKGTLRGWIRKNGEDRPCLINYEIQGEYTITYALYDE